MLKMYAIPSLSRALIRVSTSTLPSVGVISSIFTDNVVLNLSARKKKKDQDGPRSWLWTSLILKLLIAGFFIVVDNRPGTIIKLKRKITKEIMFCYVILQHKYTVRVRSRWSILRSSPCSMLNSTMSALNVINRSTANVINFDVKCNSATHGQEPSDF